MAAHTSASREIWLGPIGPDQLAPYSHDGQPLRRLAPIAPVNLFVGANNTGKSRLLRLLFKQGGLASLSAGDAARYDAALRAVDALANSQKARDFVRLQQGDINELTQAARMEVILRGLRGEGQRPRLESLYQALAVQALEPLEAEACAAIDQWRLHAQNGEMEATSCAYVPALRTAARFAPGGNQPQQDTLELVARDRFFAGTSASRILSGLHLYDLLLELRTGTKAERERIDNFERFLSETFFQGQSVDIRPRFVRSNPNSRHLELSIGDTERALHDLGEGLGALIMVLSPFFLEPEGAWIFVEEPELYLHPGYQRLFMETLQSEEVASRKVVACMTTHSNHLLGVALQSRSNVSVFRFSRGAGEIFDVEPAPPSCLRALNELGVHNASVLLAGCSVWVEGPSDRDYLRAGLLAYAHAHSSEERLLEELHYCFFEYGGSNIAHYTGEVSESAEEDRIAIRPLCNRIFLLFDRDADESKQNRFRAWESHAAQSNGACEVRQTTGTEIENDLSPCTLALALPVAFPRRMSGSSAHGLQSSDYQLPRMGSFLDSWLKLPARSFAADTSGNATLKTADKRKLASTVLRLVREEKLGWNDLGDFMQTLTNQVLGFVRRSNGL